MTSIKLLTDEHVPRSLVQQLQLSGIDCQPAEKGVNDTELLAQAQEENRAVLTFDKKDFPRLAEEQEHPGVIVVGKPLPELRIGTIFRDVLKIVDTLDAETIENTIQYIPWKT